MEFVELIETIFESMTKEQYLKQFYLIHDLMNNLNRLHTMKFNLKIYELMFENKKPQYNTLYSELQELCAKVDRQIGEIIN